MDRDAEIETLVERTATELVHRHRLDEIESLLIAGGCSAARAERLILLIPSAFAREYYEPQGISFPEQFLTGPAGNYSKHFYSSEPVYASARSLARLWLSQSRESLVLRVLDWSAEANGIKEARAKGLTPTRMSEVHHGFVA